MPETNCLGTLAGMPFLCPHGEPQFLVLILFCASKTPTPRVEAGSEAELLGLVPASSGWLRVGSNGHLN